MPKSNITTANLARHWRVTRQAVSKMRTRKLMPQFTSYKEADRWRAQNMLRSPVSGREIPQSPELLAALQRIETVPAPPGATFEEEAVVTAENVVRAAYQAYLAEITYGRSGGGPRAMKNWNDAMRFASEVRTRFLALIERQSTLIAVDRALEIFSEKLVPLRTEIAGLPATILGRLFNGGSRDTEAIRAMIDEEIDAVFKRVSAAVSTGGETAKPSS